ncbi:sensor histidine kinase [Streptomyces sp. RPT161]|uniref:sensor histidine kinase n=1 Tax=Streptomyces sp. RPT161 TaxID=3015993 RepID=UPI0022B8E514|nr:histidine kinase [Streptomyces sp. RPT161]
MTGLAGWAARHPRAVGVGKCALAFVLLFLVALEALVLARQPTRPHAIVWAAGVAVCVCAVPNNRVPLVVRAAVAAVVSWTTTIVLLVGQPPLSVWGLGEAIALLVLLTAVVHRAPDRAAVVLGPLLGLAAVAAPLRDTKPGAFTLVMAVSTTLVAAFSLVLRAQSTQRLRDLAAVRSAERRELARELHDVVAHHITGIVVQARAARFTEREQGAVVDAAESFGRIETAAGEALGAMRRLVHVLREDTAETAPLAGIEQVRELTQAFSRTGPPVLLQVESGLDDRVPPDVAAGVHRIVREALTNVVKHAADATAVRITLRTVADGLEVRIADDGSKAAKLAESARGGGFGLVGLTERAEALGGRLSAGPAPEGGWLVTAVLPLH